MSYILDALKRSEQERHQESVANLSTDMMILPSHQKQTQWWPYVLIAVLILNAGAYIYFNWSGNENAGIDSQIQTAEFFEPKNQSEILSEEISPPKTKTKSISETTRVSQIGNSGLTKLEQVSTNGNFRERSIPEHVMQARHLPMRYDLNDFQSESRVPDVDHSQAENGSGMSRVDHPERQVATTISASEDFSLEQGILIQPKSKRFDDVGSGSHISQLSSSPSGKKVDGHSSLSMVIQNSEAVEPFLDIPHLTELSLSFQRGIPDLIFNSHIYSGATSARRVMINNLYLRQEQGFLGMFLLEIGEFYIVLEKNDRQFKLPVLKDWQAP